MGQGGELIKSLFIHFQNQKKINMKKFLLMLMFVPLLGLAQTKNVSHTLRVFPMKGKATDLDKAITAHVAKFHTTEKRWRIFEVQTGPDAGGLQINEGPMTWDEFNNQPKNSDAHKADWDKTVDPLIEKTTSIGYSTYLEEYSTVKLTDYSDNIVLTHMMINPGMVGSTYTLLQKMKKAWALGNESMAVYGSFFAGDPQIVISRRLKTGLKELDPAFVKSMPDRYREANGSDSWAEYQAEYNKAIGRRWSEMLIFRADLSSK